MNSAHIGKQAPLVTLLSTGGEHSAADLRGKNLVLYFYPKDNTPGCTQEGQEFNELLAEFARHNTLVLGVSRDSLTSHQRFKERHGLAFDLVSDPEEVLCTHYDVIKMKNMYGKQVRGIERSTFLIDHQGILRQAWRKVKVTNHAAEVLATVKLLTDY
ncbi:MAG: peroxiredoxin Q/BCP [Halothiobacillaceae bacterium]|nr:MAG: peroxiredoxin Q/BCP [Halothiobacillaceae bacterium]